MAIRAEFQGWVTEVKLTEWGAYVTFSHEKRVKNTVTNQWETAGRDYLDIAVSSDLVSVVENNKLVKVVFNVHGTPKAFIGKDGVAKARLSGTATDITPVERVQRNGETVEVSTQLNKGLEPRGWAASDANLAATLGAVPVDESPF